MTSSFSLVREDNEKCAPTRVLYALGEMMIPHHPDHVQMFDTNTAIALCVVFGSLEVEVTTLAADLEMLACDLTAGFAAAMTALLPAAHPALRMRQTLLALPKVSRILDSIAF
jgi:hypothetical protein